MSNELEAVAPGMLTLAGDGPDQTWDFTTLAEKMAAAEKREPATAETAPPAEPKMPKHVNLTPEVLALMRRLPDLERLHLAARKVLTEDQVRALSAEDDAISGIQAYLEKRQAEVRETIRIHLDEMARAGGLVRADTPHDRYGHVILARPEEPWELDVPGFAVPWQQRYKSGKVTVSLDELEIMRDRSLITVAEFNALTRQVRILDPGKVTEFLRRNRARGLAIIRAATTIGRPGASLYGPKITK